MGIKERQGREREAIRRAIWTSPAICSYETATRTSRFARSPSASSTARRHLRLFRIKDDIFFALAEEGFRLLHGDRASFAALDSLPPLERIRAIFSPLYDTAASIPSTSP
jgi:hypothetical protein